MDFLGLEKRPEKQQEKVRKRVHILVSGVLILVIIGLNQVSDRSAIMKLIYYAGYTYGPLIGLFFFGILTKRQLRDKWVPYVCLSVPILMAVLINTIWKDGIGAYQIGAELILFNALLTFIGLWCIIEPKELKV